MRSQNFQNNKPIIYLIATPIGNLSEFSERAIQTIKECDLVTCEDTRNTGKLLSCFNISKPLVSLREHNEVSESNRIIEEIKTKNLKVVYMSDAGYPCISDPGAKLVEIAIQNDINVSTISGPNAGLNALVASGLPCNHFYFHGFLDPRNKAQKDELTKLKEKEETLIFYEAPHRIMDTLKNMYTVLGNRKACLARELTKKFEEFIRLPLSEMVELDPETLKGEMVIIVEGNHEIKQDSYSDETIIKMVDELVKNGNSTKDSIKMISETTKINKNVIYNIYHKK